MLKALSLEQFSDAVASEEAVPGGGSVSALAGGLAAALAAMVARLTMNKKKFSEVAAQMETLAHNAIELQRQLMTAVDRDADSYRQVLAALRLPKTTDEEKQARSRAMEAAFRLAADVPLEVAGLSYKIMELAEQGVRLGNPDMITDAGVALVLARSAALGALMNVNINLTYIKDQDVVADMGATAERIKKAVLQNELAVLSELPL
ncbi:MAG: cyclodeaminase/cyclohydrolase family protein [Desulfobacteraceae bacterium]|jgi:formiminotetrahydrofolate cyclodeaminase